MKNAEPRFTPLWILFIALAFLSAAGPAMAVDSPAGPSADAAAARDAKPEAVYKDWALRHSPESSKWVLEQRVFMEGNQQTPLVQVAIQSLEGVVNQDTEGLWALIRVPLGILLAPGLRLHIDEVEVQAIPVHHCRAEGCIAFLSLTPDLRKKLAAGRQARITFQVLNGQGVGVPVSLMGISAGLKALEGKIASP